MSAPSDLNPPGELPHGARARAERSPSKTPGLITPKSAANSGASEVTRAVRAGIECDDASGCVVPPLHLTSTFAFRGFGEKRAYDYTRSGNPTRDLLAGALAELEHGAGAVVTASGMAAITVTGLPRARGLPASSRRTTATAVPTGSSMPGTAAASGRWSSSTSATLRPVQRRARSGPQRCCGSRRRAIRLLRITDIAACAALGRASRCAHGGRQHLPLARLAAAADTRGRPRGALDHEVHQRPQRRRGRCGHRARCGAAEQLTWWANCLGLTGAPFRQLHDACAGCARCMRVWSTTPATPRRSPNG